MNGVDHIIYGRQAVLFRDVGKMGITGCCGWACVAEKGLDVTEA
jgi:hypothetical protein